MLAGASVAEAEPVSLDPAFSPPDGKLTESFGSNSFGLELAIQPNGKLLVAVGVDPTAQDAAFIVARYNADGSPDATFSGDGRASIDFGPTAGEHRPDLALQSNGKIVVAGTIAPEPTVPGEPESNDWAVARLNANGTPDAGFSGDGMLRFDFPQAPSADFAQDVAISPNGTIVVAGHNEGDPAVVRFTPAGSIAGSTVFDRDTGPLDEILDVAVQADNKVLLAGTDDNGPVLARRTTTGAPDTGFSGDGFASSPGFTGFRALAFDGTKIVAAGGGGVARFLANGTPDMTFAGDGMVDSTRQFALDLALDQDGNVVLAGSSGDFWIARYLSDGQPDLLFSEDDEQETTDFGADDYAEAVGIQADGRIVAAGRATQRPGPGSSVALARYEGGGPDCSDKLDNDEDGKIDFPADPDCEDATEDSEEAPLEAECENGADDDGDGKVDFPADPGCASAQDDDEDEGEQPPPDDDAKAGCENGADDDGDGLVDFPADPGCTGPKDGVEEECTIKGTTGEDVLTGTPGNDVICGLGGEDRLLGGDGDDRLDGGDGHDRMAGGPGNDLFAGGEGDDAAVFQAAIGPMQVDLAAGTAAGEGEGADVLVSMETVYGGPSADEIAGGSGDDTMWGGRGADKLNGRGGSDFIPAGAGNDKVSGGSGRDLLGGNAGTDRTNGGAGRDRCYQAETRRSCEEPARQKRPKTLVSAPAGVAAQARAPIASASAENRSFSKNKRKKRVCGGRPRVCGSVFHGWRDRLEPVSAEEEWDDQPSLHFVGGSFNRWSGGRAYGMCIHDHWYFRSKGAITTTAPFGVPNFQYFQEDIFLEPSGKAAHLQTVPQLQCWLDTPVIANPYGPGEYRIEALCGFANCEIRHVIREQWVQVYVTHRQWRRAKPAYKAHLVRQWTLEDDD
jgi:uncharacterized delta-60 repeat protein